jgi:cell shape-determining protein MreC
VKSSRFILMLPIVALISAFTLEQAKPAVRRGVETLFVPVAGPTRALGSAAQRRLTPVSDTDPVSPDHPRTRLELQQENEILRVQIANLQTKLDDLVGISQQYQQLGAELQKLVQPAMVLGGPTDQRQTLTISTTGLTNLRVGMAVVSPFGYVGKIHSISATGGTAKVLLATDPSSKLVARFARYVKRPDGGLELVTLDIPPPLVEGVGDKQVVGNTRYMVANLLAAGPVRKLLQQGDQVLLDEPINRMPPALRGLRLGTITKINLPPSDSGHADVAIEPVSDLPKLSEVLVVTKAG